MAAVHESGPGPAREEFRRLFARIAQHCDLPPPPTVALRALTLLRGADVHADELMRVVRDDPVLMGRAFKIASSPLFMRRRVPRTFAEVLNALGVDRLRDVILAAAARTLYRGNAKSVDQLWEHALATALAAQEISTALGGADATGRAFMAGLFHDVGTVVFHLANPVGLALLRRGDLDGERTTFGATHPEVGAALADLWGLELAVVQAVAGHHAAEPVGLARIVAAADAMAYAIGRGAGDDEPGRPAPDLGLDQAAIVERVAKAFETERGFFG